MDSESSEDISLVVDNDGVIKKNLKDLSKVKAYLSSDFTAGSDGSIYKITDMYVLQDPSDDFNTAQSIFIPSYDGIYNIEMTLTSTYTASNSSNNSVFGLADSSTGKWVMRFSVSKSYIEDIGLNSSAGVTNTFTGAVQLKKGVSYYFGISKNLKLLHNPTGTTGEGLGSYFSIELVKLQ